MNKVGGSPTAKDDAISPLRTSDSNERLNKVPNLEVEVAFGDIPKSSGGSKKHFDLLNGDLSSLIAHVQPAICSWDVSEVRLEGNLDHFSDGNSPKAASESKESRKSVELEESREVAESSNAEQNLELGSCSDESDEYMTPSEDEVNEDQDTSDTDFTVSSEESWTDQENDRPTRRSTRNRSPKNPRRRYSPPIVLRSRARKSTKPSTPNDKKNPNKPAETQNSDSGVSCVGDTETAENDTSKATLEDEREVATKTLRLAESPKSTLLIKSPLKQKLPEQSITIKSTLNPTLKPENPHSHEKQNDDIIRPAAMGSSDSENDEDKPKTQPAKVAEPKNMTNNPKWRLRASKCPLKNARLDVNMDDTVGRVFCPESQTSYSYKKVNVAKKSASGLRRGTEENFLIVRDGDQVLASSVSMPSQICGLISNMRNIFGTFFDNLDKLKSDVKDHHSENPKTGKGSCLAEQHINTLLDELKMFPDLLELEMSHFAVSCEKSYNDELDKSLKNSKKIRWCNACQEAARFHCCFSAAYCSRLCQTKDWGRHNRHCGQSRMMLDDPDLKLSPFMANRLKALEYSKPTIGTSMKNLEELCQSFHQPANGQRMLGSKKQPRKRNGGPVVSELPKRTYSATKHFPAPPTVTKNPTEPESTELENAVVKTESLDMEVEQVEPPPRSKLVKLVANSSPNKSANHQVRITIPPNLLAGLSSNVRPVINARMGLVNATTVNSPPKIASVAVVPRSLPPIAPKNTSPKTCTPVTLRCKTVTLPSGEVQYIPIDGQTWSFKPNAQLVVKHVNQKTGTPVTVVKQATTSGSILITRPAAKTSYVKFAPTNQTVSALQPEHEPPPLTPRLPKLTPVMAKPEPAVRTLNSSELDKILSTDHLKEAFDASYSSNILRP